MFWFLVDALPEGYIPETKSTYGMLSQNPHGHDDCFLSVLGADTWTETSGYTLPNWRVG
jgi:hypothetical protein